MGEGVLSMIDCSDMAVSFLLYLGRLTVYFKESEC